MEPHALAGREGRTQARQQSTRREQAQNDEERRGDDEMDTHTDAGGGDTRCHARRCQDADAPETVQPRHDWAAGVALDLDRLRVHRHVEQARGDSERNERRCEPDEVACDPGADERDGEERQADANDPPAPEPLDEPGRDPGAGEESRREAGQRGAERAVAKPQVGLDGGNPGGERPGDRRVNEEDRGDAPPRSHEILRTCRGSLRVTASPRPASRTGPPGFARS